MGQQRRSGDGSLTVRAAVTSLHFPLLSYKAKKPKKAPSLLPTHTEGNKFEEREGGGKKIKNKKLEAFLKAKNRLFIVAKVLIFLFLSFLPLATL